MRRLKFGLLGLLLGVLSACASASNSPLIGHEAPAYTPLYLLDGDREILTHFRGRNVALIFWAESCNQSHELVDALNEYGRAHAKEKNLVVFAVSIDKSENVDRLRDRIHFGKLDGMQHAFSGNGDYDEAKMAFDVESLPSLYLINPEGVVVAAGSSLSVVERALGD